jgi:patatin-like phospholipase
VDPTVRELLGYGCRTTMHLVRLLSPRLDREDHTKDIDFTRAGIRARRGGDAPTGRQRQRVCGAATVMISQSSRVPWAFQCCSSVANLSRSAITKAGVFRSYTSRSALLNCSELSRTLIGRYEPNR